MPFSIAKPTRCNTQSLRTQGCSLLAALHRSPSRTQIPTRSRLANILRESLHDRFDRSSSSLLSLRSSARVRALFPGRQPCVPISPNAVAIARVPFEGESLRLTRDCPGDRASLVLRLARAACANSRVTNCKRLRGASVQRARATIQLPRMPRVSAPFHRR